MKKLLRYLVNTILFVVIFSIPTIFIMVYAVSQYGTRPNALSAFGPILGLLIAYILVKRINKSNLWVSLFDESEAVNDVIEEKKVEVKEEKSDLSEKPKINKEQDTFTHNIGYKIGKKIMTINKTKFFGLIFILSIIITLSFPENITKIQSLKYQYLYNTYSLSDINIIDDVFYTKKDMKIIESGYLEGNFYWNKHFYKIKEGKKQGKWYHLHLTHKHSNYKLGELDGYCESWYSYGIEKKKEEIYFKNGKFNGVAKSWYENGQLESEIIFKDGKIEKVIGIWNKEGTPLNIKFDWNKIYFGSDWESLETDILSKALLYTQIQYNKKPTLMYPSYFFEKYLVENNISYADFNGGTHSMINSFFGFIDIRNKRSSKKLKTGKISAYNGDLNKIIFPNKEIKDELTIGDNMYIHLTYLSLLKRK
mgnify:CR=1 FL=1